MKRFELNFNEDRINDVLDNSGASYGLKECCDLLNEQQADLVYLARLIGEFKVEEFKVKLRNLRMLEDKVLEQQVTIQKQSERIGELESTLADDIIRRAEIKDAWKQRTEKRWNDE